MPEQRNDPNKGPVKEPAKKPEKKLPGDESEQRPYEKHLQQDPKK